MKIGFLERDVTKKSSNMQEKYLAFVLVEYYSSVCRTNETDREVTKKRSVLAEHIFENTHIDFSEQEIHLLRVSYDRNF